MDQSTVQSIFSFICENAIYAHFFIFILFLLGGLNLPISEDLLMIGGGAIASTCIPDHTVRLFIWMLVGCYLASWETYWIGRLLGPKLYHISFFRRILTHERLELVRYFYAKFGIFTFLVGRFCPGGIRNVLFLSSGLTKMPFHLYVLRDGISSTIALSTLFYFGYIFGANFQQIMHVIDKYSLWFFISVVFFALSFFFFYWHRKMKNNRSTKTD